MMATKLSEILKNQCHILCTTVSRKYDELF